MVRLFFHVHSCGKYTGVSRIKKKKKIWKGEGNEANSAKTWSIRGHVGNQGCNEPYSFPHNSLKVYVDTSLLRQIEYDILVKIREDLKIYIVRNISRMMADRRMISEI